MRTIRNWWTIYKEKHAFTIILLIAALLRLPDIKNRDFWFDEAFTGITIRESWGSMLQIIMADTHPPLYYVLTKTIANLFDYSVLSIRLVSFGWGILSIYLVYKVAKMLFTERAARFTALIAAVSPFAIYYSQEARSYAMLAGLLLIAFYYFILAIRTQRTFHYVCWGIASGLAALTHYMAIICIVLFGIAYIFSIPLIQKNKKGETVRKYIVRLHGLIIGYSVQVLLFIPWFPYFFQQFSHRTDLISWINPATPQYLLETITIFLLGNRKGEFGMGMPEMNILYNTPKPVVIVTALLFIGASCVLFFIKEKKYRFLILFPSIGYIISVYLLTFLDAYYVIPRYLIGAAFFLYIILGVALSHISPWVARTIMICYIGGLLLIVPLHNSNGYNFLFQEKENYTGKTYYFINTYDYVIGKYYFGYNAVALYNADWPNFNPSIWLGVNGSLQRTESLETIKKDPHAVIVWNTHSLIATDWEQFARKNGLTPISTYNNLFLYTFSSK